MSKIKIALNTSVMHCVVHFIKLKSTVGSEGIVDKETLKLGHRCVWKCREPTGTAHGGGQASQARMWGEGGGLENVSFIHTYPRTHRYT